MLGIGVFQCPRDIKIKQDKIFVLDESDPCQFVFTLELQTFCAREYIMCIDE